jgi:hypothetical protein
MGVRLHASSDGAKNSCFPDHTSKTWNQLLSCRLSLCTHAGFVWVPEGCWRLMQTVTSGASAGRGRLGFAADGRSGPLTIVARSAAEGHAWTAALFKWQNLLADLLLLVHGQCVMLPALTQMVRELSGMREKGGRELGHTEERCIAALRLLHTLLVRTSGHKLHIGRIERRPLVAVG